MNQPDPIDRSSRWHSPARAGRAGRTRGPWSVLIASLFAALLHGACASTPPRVAQPGEFGDWPTPAIRSLPQPPDRALRNGMRGFALAEYAVDASGRVVSVRIIESSPPRIYDGAVERTLRQWRFEPLVGVSDPVVSAPQTVFFDFCFDACPGERAEPDGVETFRMGVSRHP